MAKIYLYVNKIVKQKYLVKQDKNDKNAYREYLWDDLKHSSKRKFVDNNIRILP